jgi:polysaccharide deacetylase family sporulation protein PdaB
MKKLAKILKLQYMPRIYVICGVLSLCILALALGYSAGTQEVSGKFRELPIYNVKRDDKVVALSFDAAWGNEQTQALIDILAEYNVKTTFFVVGEWVDKFPESVAALHSAGHEVMNHSDTHPHMTSLSQSEMQKQIEECNRKIAALTGVAPKLFRPPYGDYNNNLILTLKGMGMYTIQWNIDSLDWKDLTPQQMIARIIPKVTPGSIILFHNGGKYTPDVLPSILGTLQKDGYKIVKVSEIIYYDNYIIDHTGMQILQTATGG